MSLPGLGLMAPSTATIAPAAMSTSTVAIHDLAANSEWRFEVPVGTQISVRVLSGTAEIFGTELALNHTYTFAGSKAAIFTYHGTRLEVTGSCEEYTAEETPMVSYVNTHFALQRLRSEENVSNSEGPRVLIVGPNNSGKTSLVKLLASYATRQGEMPMVVNTDSREPLLSIPGTVTATVMSSILDVEEGWGSSPTSGPSPVPVKLPLVYHYGLPSPEDNPKLYKPVITRLALATTSRMADDPSVRAAGLIIDTPGVISQGKNSYELLSHIVSEFSVNVVITLGSERLHSDMTKRFSSQSPSITILKLSKSGGCADRDDTYLTQTQHASIREYFFGTLKRTLSPHTQSIDFAALTIYKIAQADSTLLSFMPGSDEDEVKDSALGGGVYEKMVPGEGYMALTHCVLAVMYAGVHDGMEAIRDASVMGFVYVAEVDEKKRRLKILAPLGGGFSDRPLVWGPWPEAGGNLIG